MARGFLGPLSWSAVQDVSEATLSTTLQHTPRKRVTQACHQCRARKDKCNGAKPACSACKSRRKDCSYDAGIKKRGLPEGYVRDLEKYREGLEAYTRELEVAWGYLILKQNGATESNLVDQDLSVWEDEKFQTILSVESSMDGLQRVWRDSSIFQSMRLRHPVMESMEDKLSRRRRDMSENPENSHGKSQSKVQTSASHTLASSPKPADAHSQLQNRTQKLTRPLSSGRNSQPSEAPTVKESPILRLPGKVWLLLKAYFAHSHSWLPIVDKNDLLRTMHQNSINSQSPGPQPSLGSHALLWSVLAFADIQCDSAETSLGDSKDEPAYSTDQLYSYARSQIPAEDGNFDIGHIQALLLLSLFNVSLNRYQAGWLLVGKATRLAMQLGLNRCSPMSFQPAKPRPTPLAHRVFLGCFVVDTLIASRVGMCPHLGVEDVASVGETVEENGLEEWEPWIDCLGQHKHDSPASFEPSLIFSTFNLLIKVLCSANRSMRCDVAKAEYHFELFELVEELGRINIGARNTLQLSSTLSGEIKLLPHHLSYHLAHLSVLARLRITQCRSSSSANANTIHIQAKDLRRIVTRMLEVLAAYSEGYGLQTAPTTFEYFSFILLEGGRICDEIEILPDITTSSRPWKGELLKFIQEMDKFSPGYRAIRQTLEQDCNLETSLTNVPARATWSPNEQLESHRSKDITLQLHNSALSQDHHAADGSLTIEDMTSTTHDTRSNAISTSWHPACWGQQNTSMQMNSSPEQVKGILENSTSGNLLEQSGRYLARPLQPSILQGNSILPQSSDVITSEFMLDQDAIFAELSTMDVMQWYVHHLTTAILTKKVSYLM